MQVDLDFAEVKLHVTAAVAALDAAHREHPQSRTLPILHERLSSTLGAFAAAAGVPPTDIHPDGGIKPSNANPAA